MQQDFTIQKWAVWPPLSGDARDDGLARVPKMLRRRLSPLAKTVFGAANQCLTEGQNNLPTVFSSCHGELARSLKMMEGLEAGEELSPTSFSLSVHNAVAGLFAMAWGNKQQCTVLAPGEEGVAAAFLEGLGLLQEGAEQVLLVLYDEPLPDFYPSEPYRLTNDKRIALALLIGKEGGGQRLSFSCRSEVGDDGEQPVQLPDLIRFLVESQTQLVLKTPRHSWCWEKHEAA